MFYNEHKVIGILGGMGPRATIDLYESILAQTKIEVEQDHISTLIFSNPKIPDRSSTLNSSKVKLVSYLQQTAKVLETAGADVIAIPCNGSHMYLNEVERVVDIPVLNMIEKTVAEVANRTEHSNGVLLLGTTATYHAGLYDRACGDFNIKISHPNRKQKAELMEAIYNIKVDKNLARSTEAIIKVINYWKMPVILGCTEIPLVLKNFQLEYDIIDPTSVLAKSAVDFVTGLSKTECLAY